MTVRVANRAGLQPEQLLHERLYSSRCALQHAGAADNALRAGRWRPADVCSGRPMHADACQDAGCADRASAEYRTDGMCAPAWEAFLLAY